MGKAGDNSLPETATVFFPLGRDAHLCDEDTRHDRSRSERSKSRCVEPTGYQGGREQRSDDAGQVVGWAALSPVSSRSVYAGVAEVSIYISTAHQGQGIGTKLLSALVVESEKAGIWTLQAGIFPENKASIKLHKQCGFRVVGVREKVGKMDDTWRDVILLERRGNVVGV